MTSTITTMSNQCGLISEGSTLCTQVKEDRAWRIFLAWFVFTWPPKYKKAIGGLRLIKLGGDTPIYSLMLRNERNLFKVAWHYLTWRKPLYREVLHLVTSVDGCTLTVSDYKTELKA